MTRFGIIEVDDWYNCIIVITLFVYIAIIRVCYIILIWYFYVSRVGMLLLVIARSPVSK